MQLPGSSYQIQARAPTPEILTCWLAGAQAAVFLKLPLAPTCSQGWEPGLMGFKWEDVNTPDQTDLDETAALPLGSARRGSHPTSGGCCRMQ